MIRVPTNDTHMPNAQKLQNFASRVAFGGVRKHGHVSPVFRELQWLRVILILILIIDAQGTSADA